MKWLCNSRNGTTSDMNFAALIFAFFALCPPDPLPTVSFRIGDTEGYVGRGEVHVPVWIDTGTRPTWGALIYTEFPPDMLQATETVIPGPMWEGGFASVVGYSPMDGFLNALCIGWGADSGPIPAEALRAPLFWLVFLPEKAGVAEVRWVLLPEPAPAFFRRSEILVQDGDCEWDVLDWLEPQTTGYTIVESGRITIKEGPLPATPTTWGGIKELYR